MNDPRLASVAAIPALCAAFALAGAAPAQRWIAYPQDTLTHSAGTAVPFGAEPNLPGFDEGRWQQMVPSTHLPTTPTAILGLEVVSQTFTGPILHQSLTITLSDTPSETTSTQFAANLPNPSTVFQRQGHVILWQAGQWGTIVFDTPFQHDGRSNLFVDIQKAVSNLSGNVPARMAQTSDPGRSDLPPYIYAAGTLGSGAANATAATATAAAPLQLRFLLQGPQPTLVLKSDRLAGSGNVFAISGSMDVALWAQPGAVQLTWVGPSFSTRFALPGVRGEGVVLPAALLPARQVGSVPDVSTLRIPPQTALVGRALCWQAATFDATGVTFSNGVDCLLRAR